MILTLDNARLREIIPGIIHEVKGETPLYEKILPWIESEKNWLEENFLGADFDPSAHHLYQLCEKIIVYRAMVYAIPSLDVVLSPAGFAVINTEGRAPASRERVERLIDSLTASANENLISLNRSLCRIESWRQSKTGQWWCGTFLPYLDDICHLNRNSSLLETYTSARYIVSRFEREAAATYLGQDLTRTLKDAQFNTREYDELICMIRAAELEYIRVCSVKGTHKCREEHELWHSLCGVVDSISLFPELKRIWDAEMGEKFRVAPFKNVTQGGFFF